MALHGKKTYFAIEDSGAATLRNISPYVNSVTWGRANDSHDTTCFGSEGHTFITGLTNGTITVAGFWDKTALVGTATVFDGLVDLDTLTMGVEYGPEGNTAGQVKYTAEVILTSLDYSSPVADLVSFSASFQISGTPVKTTF